MIALASLTSVLFCADPDVAKFDDLFPRREDPAAVASLTELSQSFKSSNDYEKLWRATRWYDWVADGESDKGKRAADGKIGWDVGELAKKANPAGLEGKYWTSVCIGAYSEGVGILKALTQGLESKFRDPILEVVKADPNSQNANVLFVGPEIAIGRYYDQLPWPKHSTDKSKEWLNRAIKAHPEQLRAYYYLADAIKGDDKAEAKKQLNFVIGADESYDPPEAHRVKRWAKALLSQISK